MKIYQKVLAIKTKKLYDFVKITDQIQKFVEETKIREGIILIYSLHNTGTLIIQEDDKNIHKDIVNSLERIFPTDLRYEHNYEGNINATAHVKMNFLGNHISIPVRDNKLELGSWQDVFFLELFEPRNREVFLTIIGE